MRPVARVRWNAGPRSAAGLGDARAAALRGRFEQLLHGGGQGVPGVSQALSSDGAPPPLASRSAGLDALIAQPPAMPWAAAASTRSASDGVEATAQNNAPLCARPVEPAAQPAATAPSPDATLLDRAMQTGASRAPDNTEPAAALPPLPAAATSRAEMQAQAPSPQSQPASDERQGLPELVRDLVQAVVHMSRGREGQWRLTMALKPHVLGGTLVALEAEPGRLQVRFDCAGADACTRLAAVRDDLRTRLEETLSAARPVDVRVDVQLQTQSEAHGVV
jgi:flagellar hook-length control protein FliK